MLQYSIPHVDLNVGFEETSYSVAESAGVLEIPVRIFDDSTPIIGLPLGVRVTSRDGSAVGEKHLLHTLLNMSLSCYAGMYALHIVSLFKLKYKTLCHHTH